MAGRRARQAGAVPLNANRLGGTGPNKMAGTSSYSCAHTGSKRSKGREKGARTSQGSQRCQATVVECARAGVHINRRRFICIVGRPRMRMLQAKQRTRREAAGMRSERDAAPARVFAANRELLKRGGGSAVRRGQRAAMPNPLLSQPLAPRGDAIQRRGASGRALPGAPTRKKVPPAPRRLRRRRGWV